MLEPDAKTEQKTHTADVGGRPSTNRRAVAQATVILTEKALAAMKNGTLPKGDPLPVARIAGIQAAKQTQHLIPFCHPVRIDAIEVSTEVVGKEIRIQADVAGRDRTGLEMEALTAASVAALTVYDMIKAVEPGAKICEVKLIEKTGGRHGHYRLEENA